MKKIFKYQSINKYSLDNLDKRQIWFSNPFDFNDPYDCANSVRYKKLTKEEMEKILYKAAEQKGITQNRYIEDFRNEIKNNPRAVRKEFEKIKNDQENRIDRYTKGVKTGKGVCCFSKVKDNILMWSHYGDSHKGFCVEFDTDNMFFKTPYSSREVKCRPYEVKYSHTMPIVNLIDFLDIEFVGKSLHELVTTKFRDWKYEEEVRLFYIEGNVPVEIKPESIVGIYFGTKINDTDRDRVSEIAYKRYPNIRLFTMEMKKKSFRLRSIEIKK